MSGGARSLCLSHRALRPLTGPLVNRELNDLRQRRLPSLHEMRSRRHNVRNYPVDQQGALFDEVVERHIGKGEYFAVGFGNAGRAVPEIAVVFLLAALIGIGLGNVALALGILGLPPILTNTFVAIRQVDPTAVQAAEGMGMRPWQVILRVELPLAAPTIMTGIRTAAINIFATATIASFVGLSTLGDLVTGTNVYGTDGVVAGAIVIAVLAGSIEAALAGVQRLVTPRGLKLQRAARSA